MDADDDAHGYASEDEMEAQLMAQAIAASLQVREEGREGEERRGKKKKQSCEGRKRMRVSRPPAPRSTPSACRV
jgi:hypothetical protein